MSSPDQLPKVEDEDGFDLEDVYAVNIATAFIYHSALVVQAQEVWIKWCKAQNSSDHAFASRRWIFLLQISELGPIEGGGLIIAVVSTIHVTIHVIVGCIPYWNIVYSEIHMTRGK